MYAILYTRYKGCILLHITFTTFQSDEAEVYVVSYHPCCLSLAVLKLQNGWSHFSYPSWILLILLMFDGRARHLYQTLVKRHFSQLWFLSC